MSASTPEVCIYVRRVGRQEADSFVSVSVRQYPHPHPMMQETYAHEVNVALKDRRALRCESLWLQHAREKDALHTALVAVPLQPISQSVKRPARALKDLTGRRQSKSVKSGARTNANICEASVAGGCSNCVGSLA